MRRYRNLVYCITWVDEAGAGAVVAIAVVGGSLTCASKRRNRYGTGGKERTGRATPVRREWIGGVSFYSSGVCCVAGL